MVSKKWLYTVLAIFLFTGFFSLPLAAQSQWDITLNVPYYAEVGNVGGDYGAFSQYLFLVPDVKWNYFFGPEVFHVGVGLRLWTLLLESAVYPNITLESKLGNFVITADLGGWAFLVFGLYNDFQTGNVFFPDLSVAYRFGKKKFFSLGSGAMFITAPDLGSNSFVFVGTVFARFTF